MQLGSVTPPVVNDLWNAVEPQLTRATALETAAQALAAEIHRSFDDSVVIARIFVTVPYGSLPSDVAGFVKKLTDSASVSEQLRPATPILALVATYGAEPGWKDRRNSQGHVGIPLLSSEFVSGIPMISRLLKELGVPMSWVDSHESSVMIESLGQAAGLFFVEDAATAVDQQDRKIIAAQDFVSKYGVRSVFGTGGVYDTGQMAVLVVFCRDRIDREKAQCFVDILQRFRSATAPLAGAAKIFTPTA